MKALQHIILSLVFSLPFWLLLGLIYLPIYFDPVLTRELFISNLIFLLMVFWGLYGLIAPFLFYNTLRKKGSQAAWNLHGKLVLSKFYPITLGVAVLAWVYFAVVLFPLDKFIISPPKEIIFMMSFILFVAEGFKISERRWKLQEYRELSEADSYALQLSPNTLDLMVYLQSPVYLFFYWGMHYAGFYLLDQLLSPHASREIMMFVYIFTMVGFTLAIRIIGRRVEDIARIQAYIPWKSKY